MTGRNEMDKKWDIMAETLLNKCPDYVTDWYMNLKANDMTAQTS